MDYKPEDYCGQMEFLDLKYPCPVMYNGFSFSSLWQALKVVRCDDQVVWQIALSGDDEEIVNALEKEILSKHVDQDEYNERIIHLILKKYEHANMFNLLYCNTDENDTFNYGSDDPTGCIGRITKLIRNGEKNSLYISEQVFGEKE